jgi:hypothetical protein
MHTVCVGYILWGLSLSPATASAACPNEAFRTGPSADLPDCRVYELVSPPDSNGRLLGSVEFYSGGEDVFPTEPVSPFRDSFVFATRGTPLPNPSGGNGLIGTDIYQVERAASGWKITRHATPFGNEAVLPYVGGLSADHGYIFVHVGPVVEEPGTDFGSLYEGGDADYLGDPDGNFELTGIGSLGKEKLAQGRFIAPGGEHVIFSTGKQPSGSGWCAIAINKFRPCSVKKLEPEAPPTGTGAIYDRTPDGPTRVVSLLPGDITPGAGEDAVYQGSAADGTVVAFKINGTLYARIENTTTAKITEEEAVFGGISEDGHYLFYVSDGDIHRFDTETNVDQGVTSGADAQMVNVSADGSHVYFISEQQLDGSKGELGQPNLYAWTEGSPQYVTTVLAGDLQLLAKWTAAVSPVSGSGPGLDQSRTTPDGKVFVFETQRQLTTYDNAGHIEIYRYEEEGGTLVCVTCNPAGTPATADAGLQDNEVAGAAIVINNLSEDGARVFFETGEALVPEDVDGINDIYGWHEAANGGTPEVDLITSGESAVYPEFGGVQNPNVLLGVDRDGSNVFFRSQDELAPESGRGGASTIYDARVGGGFAQIPPPAVCLEDGCRPPLTPPPALPGPTSSSLSGAGNLVPRKKRQRRHRHCHRKAKNHRRCAKKSGKRAILGRAAQSAVDRSQLTTNSPTLEPPSSAAGSSSPAGPVASSGEFEDFGIKSVAAEASLTGAARHPDLTTSFALNPLDGLLDARMEDVVITLPPGTYGNPNFTPRCNTGDLTSDECPTDSQVGISRVTLVPHRKLTYPVFNLALPHPDREIARFGMDVAGFPIFIDFSVRTAGDYGLTATIHSAPGVEPAEAVETIIWGNPADPAHDEQRLTSGEANVCPGTACEAPGGKRASGLPPIAFMTNPSACQGQEVGFSLTTYQIPGRVFTAAAPMDPITDCQGLPFAPTFEATPISREAGAPTGLKTTLHLPQQPSAAVDSPSTATMREARVNLPEGMAIAAGAADGIAACSEDQVGFHEEVDAQCPDASKLGTVTFTSPPISHRLQGAIYQRTPRPGHQFGLWLVTDELGLHVKIPGEIQPDHNSGRLTAVFSDLPQIPIEEISLNVWGGPRAPLKNPDVCGTYHTSYSLTPHSSDPAVNGDSLMTIDEGCAARGFSPKLEAGVTSPIAGAFSPLVVDLTREDHEQQLAALEVTLPKGELAKLKGVDPCPDAQVASGACPFSSRIGHLSIAVGPGSSPLWLPQAGKAPTAVYLAGPYKGAPFSIVTVVPAQAGPFDLGTVTVRSALQVDPETAVATVETDPLPQYIEGVAAVYRRVHVVIDRPEFSLNPTNCSELAVTSRITATTGAIATPSSRFQVDGCRSLKFKPKLTLMLSGSSKRGGYPALTAIVKARKHDANIGSVSVALPHSEFLAQEHIVTICTRKQFAARRCPKGSVYGRAKAWTPLLDKPLSGPVYLRSSDNPLPDLVMDLRGELEIVVAGRIDSRNGGIRTSFGAVPDAPITKFVLQMGGGKKSLLTNSTDTCRSEHRATVRMKAHNGGVVRVRPALRAGCAKR